MKTWKSWGVLMVGAALAGCSSNPTVTETPRETQPEYADAVGVPFLGLVPVDSVTTTRIETPAKPVVQERTVAPGDLAKRLPAEFEPIYFETNEARLRGKDFKTVAALGNWLKKHPRAKVAVEGHTDATGTRAYNVALGARRAAALKAALRRDGIASQRIAVINKGGDETERKAVALVVAE
jgi:outer membrane protein OmpA-like peptidoglycan-associated protein